ncbi:unnamed protein product, partial [Discosporangium mesarthrocarpum]
MWDRMRTGHGRCIQGNNTHGTHKGSLAYAFDFKLREGSQVLAARAGVVVAVCDHFSEGSRDKSLLPRANFVALRHVDGTYTRYMHLMFRGVLVAVGQEVGAGDLIGLSGNTGFTSSPHLHFDAVDLLPEETSRLAVLSLQGEELAVIPSIAAIFSGVLSCEEPVEAPLVHIPISCLKACKKSHRPLQGNTYSHYFPPTLAPHLKPSCTPAVGHATNLRPGLSHATCRNSGASHSLEGSEQDSCQGDPAGATDAANKVGIEPGPVPSPASAFLPPLPPPTSHRGGQVVALIDRGGEVPFQEAAAAVVDWCLSLPHNLSCVGVIVANDRPGHEVLPMAPLGRRGAPQGAPGHSRFSVPVAMVSYESGILLKQALLLGVGSVVGAAAGVSSGLGSSALRSEDGCPRALGGLQGNEWRGRNPGLKSWGDGLKE